MAEAPRSRSAIDYDPKISIEEFAEIRPLLRKDGDIELVDVVDNRVLVALRGMCANCQVAHFTLKDVVEARLREFVTDNLTVEEVK